METRNDNVKLLRVHKSHRNAWVNLAPLGAICQ